jgi:hypothetical protein
MQQIEVQPVGPPVPERPAGGGGSNYRAFVIAFHKVFSFSFFNLKILALRPDGALPRLGISGHPPPAF